jgi:hypothetical protein
MDAVRELDKHCQTAFGGLATVFIRAEENRVLRRTGC